VQRVIDAIVTLECALDAAAPADRCLGVICAADTLAAINRRVAADWVLFGGAFRPRPPQPFEDIVLR
jgi:hypothetical protein